MNAKNLKHKYSHNICDKRILVIGPYPPPLGGVSIHIKRVITKLKKQKNKVSIFNTATIYKSKFVKSRFLALKNLIKILFITRPDIIYYHEPTESIQKLFVTVFFKYFFRYKIVTIDHDCRLLYKFSNLKKLLFRILIKKVNQAIVIGDTTNKCYLDNKIKNLQKLSVESPFLTPDISEEKNILKKYHKSVHDFIKTHTPLITANAFAPVLYENTDLYGFDLCIDLISELKNTNPNIGILWGVCQIKTSEQKKYFKILKDKIKKLGLEKNFYFYIDAPEFWVLIKKSNLFVRPTLSDGFSGSVEEALALGIPTIASDACSRTPGAVLFRTRDAQDFINKTKKMF